MEWYAEGRVLANNRTDGHNDLAILLRFVYNNQIYSENFTKPFENGGMYGHVDLPRLKSGQNGGAFWSAFVPCPKNGTDFSDENYSACKLCSWLLLISLPAYLFSLNGTSRLELVTLCPFN